MSDELDRLERQMERRWMEFSNAECLQTPQSQLERMYDAYLRALDTYCTAKRKANHEASAIRTSDC